MRSASTADPERFSRFSAKLDGLLYNYSKQSSPPKVFQDLMELARVAQVEAKRDAMFSGQSSTRPSIARPFIRRLGTYRRNRYSPKTSIFHRTLCVSAQKC